MHVLVDYVLPFLAMMAVLVAVHEGGHCLAARMLRIRVTDFAIGMGPTLWSGVDRRGCAWRLCALPIGGYVRMLGDGNAASAPGGALADLAPEDRAAAFPLRPPGHRALVVAAGPAANFLFGFLLLWGLHLAHGQVVTPPVAGAVAEGSPAAAAGLRSGDRFLSIDGVAVGRFGDVIRLVGERADRTVLLRVERGGGEIAVAVTPRAVEEDGLGGRRIVGRIGVSSGERAVAPLGPLAAAAESMLEIVGMTGAMLGALRDLVALERPLTDMGGPVKIAEVSGDALSKFGLLPFLALAAILSVNLGVMNLLPIPVLDGGHLLLCAIEAARGRPLDPRLASGLIKAGALALMFFLAAITGSDIGSIASRLIAG